jgi:hypothetical protein
VGDVSVPANTIVDLAKSDRWSKLASCVTGVLLCHRRQRTLSCRSCRPNAPFAELVRLSRTSIADEMREEHRRRVLGE